EPEGGWLPGCDGARDARWTSSGHLAFRHVVWGSTADGLAAEHDQLAGRRWGHVVGEHARRVRVVVFAHAGVRRAFERGLRIGRQGPPRSCGGAPTRANPSRDEAQVLVLRPDV